LTSREMNVQPARTARLLLVTGLPGTGKTFVGDYLRDNHQFTHWNVEALHEIPDQRRIADWRRRGADVVVTWGFMPGASDAQVRFLQARGFMMVWFGGSVETAKRVWTQREARSVTPIPAGALEQQLERIARMNLTAFGATVIDPFAADGSLRLARERAQELLALFP